MFLGFYILGLARACICLISTESEQSAKYEWNIEKNIILVQVNNCHHMLLVYQCCPLVSGRHVSLVVSPLRRLMLNQVQNWTTKGVASAASCKMSDDVRRFGKLQLFRGLYFPQRAWNQHMAYKRLKPRKVLLQ